MKKLPEKITILEQKVGDDEVVNMRVKDLRFILDKINEIIAYLESVKDK